MIKVDINGKDITKLIESANISNDVDSMSSILELDIVYYEKTDFKADINLGDKIQVKNEEDVFSGIIIKKSIENNKLNITAVDKSFYLSNNKVLKQVRNTTGKQAINSICSELGININIKGLDVKIINKIFKNKTLTDVIKEIAELDWKNSGKKYCVYCYKNDIYLEPIGTNKAIIEFKINNVDTLKDKQVFETINKSWSIENLKNSVIVTTSDDKTSSILAKEEDGASISKYGKLQEVITVDANDNQNKKTISKNTLKSLNKVEESISIKILTNKYIFSGQKIKIEDNDYIIKSCNLELKKDYYIGELGVIKVE